MGTNTVTPTPPPDTHDVIRTRKLVLVDDEGRERARLFMRPPSRPGDKIPVFQFLDREGRVRIEMAIYNGWVDEGEEERPAIDFYDLLERRRLMVGLSWDQSWLLGTDPDLVDGTAKEVPVMRRQSGWAGDEYECENESPARAVNEEPTITPEDTLHEAGVSNRRQARYQRRMSALLAGRPEGRRRVLPGSRQLAAREGGA